MTDWWVGGFRRTQTDPKEIVCVTMQRTRWRAPRDCRDVIGCTFSRLEHEKHARCIRIGEHSSKRNALISRHRSFDRLRGLGNDDMLRTGHDKEANLWCMIRRPRRVSRRAAMFVYPVAPPLPPCAYHSSNVLRTSLQSCQDQ